MHKETETEIKEHLEEIGRDYNLLTSKRSFQYYLERRKKILKSFCENSIKNNSLIVDLASGIGSYSQNLTNYRRLLNVDLSFNALKANIILDNKISRINANGLNIPLKDNSVDSILLIGLLHHVPYCLPELFKEILRILRKGGTIFIDEANGYNIIWFVFMNTCEIDKYGTRPLFPYSLKKLARNFRLTIEKELYWGFFPPLINNKFIINIFDKIESVIERSFLSYLCIRYTLILKK